MKYTIDSERRLILMVGSGRLMDEEMVECVSALRDDPALEHDMHTLSDMRGIQMGFTKKGVAEMVAIMRRTRERRSGAKLAIVVDSDVAFGMGRMFQLRAEGQSEPDLLVFRDMAEARGWLGTD